VGNTRSHGAHVGTPIHMTLVPTFSQGETQSHGWDIERGGGMAEQAEGFSCERKTSRRSIPKNIYIYTHKCDDIHRIDSINKS